MGIGAAIVVLALILLFIARPGCALVLLVIAGLLFAAFMHAIDTQTAESVLKTRS
jgi:hypothetical protein